jgi:polyferredoxin
VSQTQQEQAFGQHLDDLYAEASHWHVNTGKETIHAKRVGGRFRTLKWWSSAVWLAFFLGPYLRWDGRQAVLFDIPSRQYHIFGATVLPQDFWMLSLLLLFFAILLAVVTATAGRVWCGYFCFQTVWTDLFTLIEEKFEGPPQARRKLDAAPWSEKLRIKVPKHLVWILIGMVTGASFVAWFTDGWAMWGQLLRLELPPVAYVTIAVFTAFTYVFAGHMREQVCFWLCPYARLQGVMYDRETILPTYDLKRGEPRGRVRRGDAVSEQGDCIDCRQCVAVCPTGIDIREGQQEGCITCALCIDACDAVMDKVDRPRGLIRDYHVPGPGRHRLRPVVAFHPRAQRAPRAPAAVRAAGRRLDPEQVHAEAAQQDPRGAPGDDHGDRSAGAGASRRRGTDHHRARARHHGGGVPEGAGRTVARSLQPSDLRGCCARRPSDPRGGRNLNQNRRGKREWKPQSPVVTIPIRPGAIPGCSAGSAWWSPW